MTWQDSNPRPCEYKSWKSCIIDAAPPSKGGTIYRYDWYRKLFSPSIYRIEEVDLISPYRKCVIFVVHESFHVWFMTASKHNLGSMKVASSRASQTDWLLYRGLISARMLDLQTGIMDDIVGQPSFMTPRMPSFSGLRRSMIVCDRHPINMSLCRYIDRQMVDISIWNWPRYATLTT